MRAQIAVPQPGNIAANRGSRDASAVQFGRESPALRKALHAKLSALAQTSTGSATRVERLIVLVEPPSLDAGEITDKGSLNTRAILTRREPLVQEAHADRPPDHVIDVRKSSVSP